MRAPQPPPTVRVSVLLTGELADALKAIALSERRARTKIASEPVERMLRARLARDADLRRLVRARAAGRAAGWKDRPRLDDLVSPPARGRSPRLRLVRGGA